MKVTYTVPKETYEEVQKYVDEALNFFMSNEASFDWECIPNEHGYIVKVTVDEKEDINPY